MKVVSNLFLYLYATLAILFPFSVLSQSSDATELHRQSTPQVLRSHGDNASLPWVMDVDAEPTAALLELPTSSKLRTEKPKVWLHYRSDATKVGDRLVEYTNAFTRPIIGCMGTTWEKCHNEVSQSVNLSRQISVCLQDPQINQYFISRDGGNFICLARLVPNVQAGVESGKIAVLAGINGRWQPRRNPIFLNDLFATAPHWTPSDQGIRSIACARITSAVAAYSTNEYWKEITAMGDVTELTTPRLVWAWTYLAKRRKPYTCGLANYLIDHLDVPLGVLPDGTALVSGLRTVIRIRIIDGSTDAPARLVRRVSARTYIEQMMAAGQPDCVEPMGKQPCHWVGNQRSGTEENYARRWLEGFDRAAHQIYFINFKD